MLTRITLGNLARRPTVPARGPSALARAASYPGDHPVGWFHLADSRQLRRRPLRVRALGEDLTLRREPGGVTCLDAHRATWPTCEAYGMVFAWRGPPGPPRYRPDQWPEVEDGRFTRRGRYTPRDIHMHLWEFAENGVDLAHFSVLHDQLTVPWTQIPVPGMSLRHEATWQTDPERPWVAHFRDEATLVARGRPLPETTAGAHAVFLGPGSVVVFRIAVPRIGQVLIFQTQTPVQGPDEPLRLRVRFTWFAERRVWTPLVLYVVGNWVSQWWRDVEVWENKVHLPRPVLCADDGPVHRFRKWYRQFYAGLQDRPRETRHVQPL